MDSFNERRYDRQRDEDRYNSQRDERNPSRHSENRFEHREFDSPQSGGNYGNRGYGSDENGRDNRNEGSYNNHNYDRSDRSSRYGEQSGSGYEGNRGGNNYQRESSNERHGNVNAYGSNRGYGSQYRNDAYADQQFTRNTGRDSHYESSLSGDNSGRNSYSNLGDQNSRQSSRWEGRNDEDYNDWSNGRKSRGLGRSETGNHFGESHRGKGPKNYTRSDSRIKEDISDALTDHHGIDASDIEIEISSGTVILKGTVDSRSAKRQAEDAIENVSGVRNVENRLHLKSENHSDSSDKNERSTSNSEKSTSDSNGRNGKISA